jgi:hypothetical protein
VLTLNQIVSQITNLATAHEQIAESGVGDFAEWQAKERTYPILWVFHESTAVSQMEIAFSIRLICADRVIVGEEGDDTQGHEQEVISDTLLVLLDFLAYFQQNHSQPYDVVTSATIDPFTERLNDRLAGNSVTIQIRQPFDWNKCQIPQTGASIPPTVDGLTLYNFCDPSVIARLSPAQVACLQSEYALPATITINSDPFASVPSGDTLDVPVVNGGSNPVGAEQGGEWVIGNSEVFINAVQVADIVAEDTANLAVELDGVPAGTWNAGTQTWEVTSTPCADGTVNITNTDADPIASVTVGSGDTETYVIPNVSWTNSNGDAESTPYGDAIVCTPPTGGWVRPSEWIAIPDLIATDERFYGVLAVFENAYNSLSVNITSGQANIDFGDGSSVVSSGVAQFHVYDYASLGGTVNVWPDGRNFKQVLVDITRIGGPLLSVRFTGADSINPAGGNNFIDINCSLPNTTILGLSLSVRPMRLAQRVRVLSIASGCSCSNATSTMPSLRVLDFPYGSIGNGLAFNDSSQIDDTGDVIFTAPSNITTFWLNSNIKVHGDLDAGTATSLVSYTNGCTMMQSAGDTTGAAVTTMVNFRTVCRMLQYQGVIDTPLCQNIQTAFQNCISLIGVEFTACANITNTTNTFNGCSSLNYAIMPGLTRGVSFANTAMGNYGMNLFANSLGIAVGVQNITVTGTPFGAKLAALDATAVAIAAVITGKGYGIIN